MVDEDVDNEDGHTEDTNSTDVGEIDAEQEVGVSEDKPSFNRVVEPEPEIAARRPIGRGFVLSGFVVSALLGGGLGVVGSKVLSGPDKTEALRAELSQELEDIKSDLSEARKSQTKKLSTANSAHKKSKNRLKTLETKNKGLAEQIETLEQDLADLQAGQTGASEIALEAYNERIAVLEALASGEDADMFKGATSISARLQALESGQEQTQETLSGFGAAGNNSKMSVEEPDLEELGAETSMDEESSSDINGEASEMPTDTPAETALVESESRNAETTQNDINDLSEQIPETIEADNPWDALEILTDTFPRAKMLAAVRAQEKLSSEKPGWLKRALSKHIKVRDEDITDPYTTINAAETALKEGRVLDALAQISKLNPPVRTSAAEWIQAAKKAAPIIEQDN